ncbi:MAG TPA: response regulator [Anaeromyxobacteraceae bacterium]|nr:response regulator [Anaeromyxobacteraceae bacterium]
MTKERILLVEDEGLVALSLRQKLVDLGYVVPAVAASGEEAIRAAVESRPQLVLMDIRLGGDMDGVAAAARIRESMDVPVVYLTAYSDQGTLERAKETGPFGYLVKPVDDRELRSTVEIALARHALERRVRESERWFSTTLRSIGDAVIATDLQGNVTFVNPAAEGMTGWTRDEVLGRSVSTTLQVVHSDTRAPVENPVLRALKDGETVTLPERCLLVARDGKERQVGDTAAPIRDERGEMLGAVVVFQDRTLHALMEAERARRQSLEHLGLLAGGIAHDFNNLLTAVLANISLARESLERDARAQEWLADAERAVGAATALSRQLLTFAKGGAPVTEAVATERLVRESVTFALRGSTVQCRFEVAGDVWPVQADPAQVGRVLGNLARNAEQALPAGGTVTVRATNVAVEGSTQVPVERGRYVRIEVEDQGVGIPADQIGRVFDPYFTTKPGGSGLGLAVAYSIVVRHGGHIEVSSRPGSGTTFTLYLPASARHPSAAAASAPRPAATPGAGRILVMDDEPAIRSVARSMLGRLGWAVEVCQDGGEAVRLYREAREEGRPFTAVILDLTVPGGMGGVEALARLREMDPGVAAIVSSGYSDDAVMADHRAHGFAGAVSKPYGMREIGDALRALLADRGAR